MNFLLSFLNFTNTLTLENWQLQELNAIVRDVHYKTEILTISLFGQPDEIEPYIRVLEQYNTPKLVITRNYGEIHFNKELAANKKIFFIAVASLERKALWNHMNNAFRGIHGYVKGVFITTRPKGQNTRFSLRSHFEWCWQKGFTSALILVDNENVQQQHFEIYNYNHFLPLQLINMTHFSKDKLYPDKFRNLNKFKIRTAGQFDPPRVYEGSHIEGKHKDRLFGYVALMFQAFIKEYNADMDLQYFGRNKSYNIMDIIQRIENDEIDLGLNPYIPYKSAYLSYPLRMQQRCVVIPFPEELAKYKIFTLPFESGVWQSFVASWFVLSIAKLFGWYFKIALRGSPSAPPDVSAIFLDVWRLIMYLPSSTSRAYRDLNWFIALWFAFVAIMGFIFSNLYMASLTSFFSGLTFKAFVNTLAELVEKRIQIDVVDYEIPAIIKNRDLPKDFDELLQARFASDLLNDIIALKSNHSYTDLEDRIQFVLSQQKHLLHPISQKVSECLTTVPLGFLIPPHSPFERALNRFILRSNAAGLIEKWFLDSLQDGYYSGVLTMRVPKLQITRPLSLKHFQFGWFVLGGGYMAGALAFLLETLKKILKRFKVFIVFS